MDLVLNKVLYLKFVNKKRIQRRDLNKILVKELVIFIKIFCSKILIGYCDIYTHIEIK